MVGMLVFFCDGLFSAAFAVMVLESVAKCRKILHIDGAYGLGKLIF